MVDNRGMYREIISALKEQLDDQLSGENLEVYSVPYQNIPAFPAVTIEVVSRIKPKAGIKVKKLEFNINVWVYVNILDSEDAQDECLRIVELVENAIEKDKTLGGTCHYLSIDDVAEFGTVLTGENFFLMGAKLPVVVMKHFA